MALDDYITLGRSGLRVSPLCLGAMTFGQEWGFGVDETDSHAILSEYFSRGGNFIDTANVYTKGHSEVILGNFLNKSLRRDRAVIATKFFGTMHPGDPNAGGANRKSIMQALEASLRRLRTDYIDLYWMHCWDKFTPIEETMSCLDDLVRSGKVRYIGFSDTPAWKTAEAHTLAKLRGWTTLSAIQIEYSLLERTVEGELLPMALELGLGVTPWSPLKFGILSGKYTRENSKTINPARGDWVTSQLAKEKTFDVIDVVISVAKQMQTTPARIALAWVQAQPGVTSSIIGVRTKEQLLDNIAAADIKLDKEQLKLLADVSKPKLNFPFDFLKGAGTFMAAETKINGEAYGESLLAPKTDAERFEGN